MLSKFKPAIDNTTQKLVSPLTKVSPNLLTLIGIVPSILFYILVLNHLYVWSLVAFLGNVFDTLDGAVAKRFNKQTPFGGFLDSTFDRIADFFIIMSFAFANIVTWQICVVLLVISYLVSYARSRAELASGARQIFAVGLIERTERLAIIFLALLGYILFPNFTFAKLNFPENIFIILILLSTLTFLQRLIVAYRRL